MPFNDDQVVWFRSGGGISRRLFARISIRPRPGVMRIQSRRTRRAQAGNEREMRRLAKAKRGGENRLIGTRRSPRHRLTVAVELTFLGDALERFTRALDTVLIIIAVGRQQFDDLVTAARPCTAHRTGREVDGLSDRELVCFQRHSPVQHSVARGPKDT